MIVPLMIWSACTDDRQPGMHEPRRASPTAIASDERDQQRRRDAEDRRSGSSRGPATRSTPTIQPTNAARASIPSMPMLTTPERSHRTPHRAAKAIGIGRRQHDRRDDRQDRRSGSRRTGRSGRGSGSRTWISWSISRSRLAAVGARRTCRSCPRPDCAPRRRKTRSRTGLATRKNRIDRLEHVDQLGRDAGLDLHRRGAAAHHAEQERGEEDADRVRPAEQRHGDRVEADARAERGRHLVGRCPSSSMAPASPASIPAVDIVDDQPARRHARRSAPRPDSRRRSGSRSQGRPVQQEPDDSTAMISARMMPRCPLRPMRIGSAALPTSW